MKWAFGIGLFLAGFLVGRFVPSPSESPSIVSPQEIAKLEAHPKNIKTPTSRIKTHGSLPESPAPSNPHTQPQPARPQAPQSPEPKRETEAQREKTPPPISWKEAETNLEQVDTRSLRDEFLEKVRVSNLFPYLQDSSAIKDTSQLENMNGTFRGRVVLDSKEQWRMIMKNRVYFESNQIKGRSNIKLSREGEVFSHADHNGKIDNLKSHSASVSYLLEAGPRTYFHLFYQRIQDRFIGNYYERQSPGVWTPKGTVVLRRH